MTPNPIIALYTYNQTRLILTTKLPDSKTYFFINYILKPPFFLSVEVFLPPFEAPPFAPLPFPAGAFFAFTFFAPVTSTSAP